MLIYHHAHSEFLLETAQGFRILTDPFDAHVGYPMREVQCDAVTTATATTAIPIRRRAFR